MRDRREREKEKPRNGATDKQSDIETESQRDRDRETALEKGQRISDRRTNRANKTKDFENMELTTRKCSK